MELWEGEQMIFWLHVTSNEIFHFRKINIILTSSKRNVQFEIEGTSYNSLSIWPERNIESTDFMRSLGKAYHHLSNPSSLTSFSSDSTYWFMSQKKKKTRWFQQLIPISKFGQQSHTYAYRPSSLQASWQKWQHHEHQEQPANISDYIIMKRFVIFHGEVKAHEHWKLHSKVL